ncbi:MAG: hypothetical protein KKI08_22270, partial [Armatimonadetes bacterium]|nr:hypothetical protein [Armatimonadota bacterium]
LRQASLHGFLNLVWSGQEQAVLLKPAAQPTSADLTYHFTSPFTIKSPKVMLEGSGQLKLELSADGVTWTEADSLPDLTGRNFWARVTLSSAGGDKPGVSLRSLAVTSGFAGPDDHAMALLPVVKDDELFDESLEGDVLCRDDFQAPRYLHLGEITGGQDLQWRPGELSIQGVNGRGVRVEIKQHFTSQRPLNLARVALKGLSIGALGAHNELAFSLDGKTPLASASSAGKGRASDGLFSGELAVDLAGEPKAQGALEFWVHLVMANGSGKTTNVSNRLRELVLTGGLAK